MRIVQIAPFEEPVPPEKYGGTELVVYNLCEEMTKLGHEVYLLAAGDSKVSCHLVPIIPKSLRKAYSDSELNTWREFLKIFHIGTILKLIREIKPDIVHNHFAWRLLSFADLVDCPMYSTIHGPITSIKERFTYEHFSNANYISISNNQREAMPNLNWVKTIYNGIDLDKFPFKAGSSKNEYFCFLGRISPEKGIKELCAMIRTTKHKLVIAAKVDPVDQKYYQEEVKPQIDGTQIKFIGEVDHAGKVALFKDAKGMLLWLNWDEPFGLAVVEAQAMGVPVYVNGRGSMPEIVKDGKTGFIVNSLDEMRQKLELADTIDPTTCRNWVAENFSQKKMALDYLELAGKLIG